MRSPSARLVLTLVLMLSLPVRGQEAETAPAEAEKPSVAETAPATSTAPATQPTEAPDVLLSADLIRTRIKQVQEDGSLSEDARQSVVNLYNQALAHLETANEWIALREQYRQRLETAPQRLEEAKAALAQPQGEVTLDVPENATVAQLRQKQADAEAARSDARKEFERLEREPQTRQETRASIATISATARASLEEIEEYLSTAPPADELPALTLAKRTEHLARQKSLVEELAAYRQQVAMFDGTVDVLTARKDVASLMLSRADRIAKAWEQRAQEQLQIEADRRAKEAAAAREAANKATRSLADENVRLAEENTRLVDAIGVARASAAEAQSRLAVLKEDYASLQAKVERASGTRTIGLLLRRQQQSIPNVREKRRLLREIRQRAEQTEIALLDHQRDLRPLVDNLDAVIGATMTRLEADKGFERSERDTIENAVRTLLETRRDDLRRLITNHSTYLSLLSEWETGESDLINVARSFDKFIDEHIWWIRSHPGLHASDLTDAWSACGWFVDRANWAGLGQTAVLSFRSQPVMVVLFGLGFTILILIRRRIIDQLARTSQEARKRFCVSIRPTAAALVYTILLVLPVPLLMWFISWRLSSPIEASEFARAFAAGLIPAAITYFMTSFVMHVFERSGLAESHLDASTHACRLIRRHVPWFTVLAVPSAVIISMLEWHNNPDWQASLGRLIIIITLLAFTVFNHLLLRTSSGVFRNQIQRQERPRFQQVCFAGHMFAILFPLVLAGLVASGYYYTTIRLSRELRDLLLLMLSVLFAHALVTRWILIAHRRLTIDQARRQRESMQKTTGEAQEPAPAPESGVTVSEEQLDISAVGEQTTRLARTIALLILAAGTLLLSFDVLPAFARLKSIPVWPGGQVSLADLAGAIIVAGIALLLSQNLPGFLEIAFLRRLPLDAGGRYAVSTITRYVLVVTGVVIAAGMLGMSWSKVQWLVAAVTVGLGFGLQEIFANFVSGLIILLERPIRVGDTVTVGGISGTVTKIRIRATTIIDWDRKELIIPNKEFVTGQVINWSLSDTILRVIIPVGIAYGSDTELAEKLLLETARENKICMEDPPPRALFLGFGDNALNFEIRLFVPSIDYLLQVRHEMHMAIDRKFRAAGIEIAFPQRDVHIKSIKAWPPFLESQAEAGSVD